MEGEEGQRGGGYQAYGEGMEGRRQAAVERKRLRLYREGAERRREEARLRKRARVGGLGGEARGSGLEVGGGETGD